MYLSADVKIMITHDWVCIDDRFEVIANLIVFMKTLSWYSVSYLCINIDNEACDGRSIVGVARKGVI